MTANISVKFAPFGRGTAQNRAAPYLTIEQSGTDHYLELLRQSGLLQHCVRRVPGLDFAIDDKVHLGNRAAPDFMIALTSAYEDASSGEQQPLKLRREAFHQTASSNRRVSSSNVMGLGGV